MTVLHRWLAACLLFVPLTSAAQNAPPATSTSADNAAALAGFDELMAETLPKWNVPGVAVSIVKDGQVVLAKGYGVRDPATGQPMTKDTLFPIASMTKAFTSFDVGLLMDEGRVSFDAPVAAYLPGFALKDPAASAGLTLRDMLSHRSGLPRHDAIWYHTAALTREALLARMPFLEPSAPLRAKWQYNNLMFILSGLVVDRVSGGPWENFTAERIFKPLEMTRTTLSPEQAAVDPDHSGGRGILCGKPVNVPLFRNSPILNPAGGIYSCAGDLANWMGVHLTDGTFKGKAIVQPATLAEIHRPQMLTGQTVREPENVPIGYAMGWFNNLYRGHMMVSHGGNLPGSSTIVALLPEQRLGVVVLVNYSGSELRDALPKAIFDRFLGATGKDWLGEALARKNAGEAAEVTARSNKGGSRVPNTQPSHALADYAGDYADPGYGSLTIRLEGDHLVAKYNDDSAPLEHWHYDVFDAATHDVENAWLDGRMQFVTDLAGRISAVQIVLEPAVGPVVFKKQPDAKLSDPAYLQNLAGAYALAGRPVSVSLSGHKLTLLVRGGVPTELLPSLGGEFVNALQLDARIVFQTDATGRATGFTITDTEGVYEAKRAE